MGKQKDSENNSGDNNEEQTPAPESRSTQAGLGIAFLNASDGTPTPPLANPLRPERGGEHAVYSQFMKLEFISAPIKEAGRVAYLGESSNLNLLVHNRHGTADVVHYPLPENVRGSRARLTALDNVEIDILHRRGAFLLPPRSLCDELVESYFKWVAPIVPVINRTRFMKQYHDAKNPPSLLLLQAVLLAGSKVCSNPQLIDVNGSTSPAALIFYKRAKALYDANYEDDRVTIVQALVLIGWHWEGPEAVTKNVFYWSRVAMVIAQGSGMHRSVEGSQLNVADKRLWKRIWWTLFTRDRSVAVALGRPLHINTDFDVEMVTEDDFIEDDDPNNEYAQDPLHVQFFLQYVKLCEIMGLVLSHHYSVAPKARRRNVIDLTHSDMALADWLRNCPKEVCWESPRHHFWAALLHSNYYTTLCLLHRAHMPPISGRKGEDLYQSWNIACQAAAMITSIIENLSEHNELRYCPAFIIYSLFSALVMHVSQVRSNVPSVMQAAQDRIQVCMNALKDVTRVWLVAKMVHTLFIFILGNKILEERLQKAPGKRHQKMTQSTSQNQREEAVKRKCEDISLDLGVTNGPGYQESYERARSRTPSATTARELPQNTMGAATIPLNAQQSSDPFTGGTNSQPQTRPATPFNPSFSAPPTPPDLYLITRNSPNLSQFIWENFQPDQLFPEGSSSMLLPLQANQTLDPIPIPHTGGVSPEQMQAPGQRPQRQPQMSGSPVQANLLQPGLWRPGFSAEMPDMQSNSPSDSWNNSSTYVVPTTLDVEEWFQFFGINGRPMA